MGLFGALEISTGGAPQDVDVSTIELFSRFFTAEELIQFQLLELSARELAILKVTVLQELARLIAERPELRIAVRARVQAVFQALGRPAAGG